MASKRALELSGAGEVSGGGMVGFAEGSEGAIGCRGYKAIVLQIENFHQLAIPTRVIPRSFVVYRFNNA
jgi:hypothetical protein